MPKPQDADLRDVIGRKFDALGTHHPFEDLSYEKLRTEKRLRALAASEKHSILMLGAPRKPNLEKPSVRSMKSALK